MLPIPSIDSAGSRGVGRVRTGLTDIIDRASSCSIQAKAPAAEACRREKVSHQGRRKRRAGSRAKESGESIPHNLVAGETPDQPPHFEDTDRGEHLRGGQAA